ncbi:MAG: hypothetical protein A3C80_03720 [Candidatus Ryanbacteria bacterium RIFCSPHIGHO2_02_FULL_45_43]|uniref:Short-chain dehydrogenase n=1 Tax=Candidatus Ryanbacteria bacterium RIFCSPHIGHO2_01_45_13 TaxID=1802112 RepID=A0A1G2FZW9_9BACT|nr:MAG: hypothetical protein A2718_02980 [Candidatus Ryanbacteria bacterium RIFCSPHIGHO2_01_FULL_44_130]OGZ43140.1 MAG: hypothetical protein A2W41_00395 [Candidatus Ryanbacteria bacterium RIFCSPHIGHO2_01_45_13]OGZ47785.1 MAG: hypothetical protein A3C80_03720 [Candidatus Ryanbacteria bacterium RIFCSPHIGHO2_02_FULL_45_43]OGZ49678.1 MAG: hypothetical protein A3E55_02175 [Candidatus Ryanbacteria bacterium RIFCSPHIGHO2_12_FULL_44_20]OGZ52171.1 MAG: hypothetical protein A3A17_03040 [Candidatus Ryanba
MDLELQGKCAIITGGTRNLGRAISLGFLQEGAKVVATYLRDDASAQEFLDVVPSDRRDDIRIYKLDVSSAISCRKLCVRALREFSRIDVLVNNASVIYRQSPDEITDKDFEAIMGLTLRSTLYMMRAVFPVMKQAGGGRIVNISTAGVYTGNASELLYICAKAGVEAATRAYVRLGSNFGITANAIAPHVIDIGMGRETISQDPTIVDRIPLQRIGRVEEYVNLVLFLSSRACEYMAGQILHLNGARLMR